MAITKKTEGHLTITDLTDITDIYLQYGLALASATVTNSYTFSGTGEVGWSTTYPTWISGYQIWIRQVRIKEGINNPEYGTPYIDTAVNQINNNYINLNNKIKKVWSNSTGSYMASGIGNNDVDENNISTYGYNSKSTTTGISFNYNAIPLIEMGILDNGDFNGIKLYSPVLTGSIITNNRLDATLTSEGLKLLRGGIVGGSFDNQGADNHFVYLSTEDYPLREFILTEDQAIDNTKTYYQFDSNSQTYIEVEEPNVSEINTYYELTEAGIPINNYTPTKGDDNLGTISNPAWRQVIGTKFGVDSEGNLYASGANINGAITATSLTIQSNGSNYDGMAAINISGYDITIEIYNDDNESDPNNYTYLIPHMYHNGENIDNTITDRTDFIWYRDDSSIGTAGAAIDGGIRAYRGSTYRVVYEFEDGAVGDSTTIQDRYLYPTEYITDITDAGIKVHPKEWITDSNYLQIDGNGIYVKNSNDIELAHFTGTDVQIGQSSLNNVFIDDDSLDIRIGNNTLASFSANNVIIGKSSRTHSRLSSNGMFFYDETNQPVAFIAYVSGSPFFTFGTRKSSALVSPYSFAEGEDVSASGVASHAEGSSTYAGHYAHAEGYNTQANGYYSHAQNNGTIASKTSQTVIGEFNIEDTENTHTITKAFIIGNGSDDSNRSNALAVNWGGDVEIAGTLTQGSDRRLKNHKTYLSTDAIDFINNLKPAYYTKDNQPHVGFYAQDVEEIDPWNCMVGEMNGYKTLGYTEIIAPLVAYCQHLEERILELENK